ncbi:MAG TPA: hypothetical protein VFS84_01420, partial [Candidatus Binatia bacterium]|nr:hypothetical protein [Candidatus Binatia bacterium]
IQESPYSHLDYKIVAKKYQLVDVRQIDDIAVLKIPCVKFARELRSIYAGDKQVLLWSSGSKDIRVASVIDR